MAARSKSDKTKIEKLRTVITESLRVQQGGATDIAYVDVRGNISAGISRANHVIYGRRGTGKTLLLHEVQRNLPPDYRIIYVNCEDYKSHSFPNVLIELHDQIFKELESHLTAWFGRKRKLRTVIADIRKRLNAYRQAPDELAQSVKERNATEAGLTAKAEGIPNLGVNANLTSKSVFERQYNLNESKLTRLNLLLPSIKEKVAEFFKESTKVKAVFIELDDFYQLDKFDQPFIMDFVHRLCKGVPLFFKVATLRHASALYAERNGQPFGAQERNDYQPINVDFTLSDFADTKAQLIKILEAFGDRAGLTKGEVTEIFKGDGLNRLVLLSGGVPRDFLSIFLDFSLEPGSIGKDEVRQRSKSVVETRMRDLKSDSRETEHYALLRSVYAIREFCMDQKSNVFLLSERELNKSDELKAVLQRLLDYKIIHLIRSAVTRKRAAADTYQAYMIDLGFYASFRKMKNRFREYDITDTDAIRNAPVLDHLVFRKLVENAPDDVEADLRDGGDSEDNEP